MGEHINMDVLEAIIEERDLLRANVERLEGWHAWFFDRLNEAARAHFCEEDFHGNLTNEGNRTMVVRLLGNMARRINENYSGRLRAEAQRDGLRARSPEVEALVEAARKRLAIAVQAATDLNKTYDLSGAQALLGVEAEIAEWRAALAPFEEEKTDGEA